jgi:hypothetical protein
MHHPCVEGVADARHLLWNHLEVRPTPFLSEARGRQAEVKILLKLVVVTILLVSLIRLCNRNQVAEVLTGSAACVAVLNGHYHPGGFCVDRATYFWGMEGVVETADDGNAFAIVKLEADGIHVTGAGVTVSRSLPLLK